MTNKLPIVDGELVDAPDKEYIYIAMYHLKAGWFLYNRPYYYIEALSLDMKAMHPDKYVIVRIPKPPTMI